MKALLVLTLAALALAPALGAQPAAPAKAKTAQKAAAAKAPRKKAAAPAAKPAAGKAKAAGAKKAKPESRGSQSSQKQGLEQQQKDLQRQIGRLQQDITLKQSQKQKEAAEAARAKKALSASAQKLERLNDETKKTRTELAGIRRESGRVEGSLAATRRDISTNAKLRYLHANRTPWENVIAGTSPAEASRNQALLAYLAASHQKKADTLEDTRDQLKTEERRTASREKSLAANAASEKANSERLAATQEQHEANAKQLDAQVAKQKKQVEELRRDQQRLAALIRQINAAIAAQEKARREKLERQKQERAKKAEEERRRAAEAKRTGKPVPEKKTAGKKTEPEEPAAPSGTGFGKLKGRLPMPASGRIAAGFGQSREGAGTWQGLMIRASLGSAVRAVAEGTVVYAGNLRGYGNLIILDHGDNYLSVYAYNSALLKSNGAHAASGETIARVGPGENGNEPGLYFEIRYKGRPVNPRPWLK